MSISPRPNDRDENTAAVYVNDYEESHADPDAWLADAEFVRALDLRTERIRRLQEALCECRHRDFLQADLHDETCPVYVIAARMKEEYEPRV